MEKKLKLFLDRHKVDYDFYPWEGKPFPPPLSFWEDRQLVRCKNLFFRDNHGKNHFLVVTEYSKKLDIKHLQELTGRGSMTMASNWRLQKYLGLKPGFISVFGILNDREQHVQIILDRQLEQPKKLSFLPNTEGTGFIAVSFRELAEIIRIRGNSLLIEELV
jgi:Ala-tRNA(Pro) deacylase